MEIGQLCRPMVPGVLVNGRGPYRFVLDTGSSGCIIAPGVADELKLPRGKDRLSRGGDGGIDIPGYESWVSSLAVGEDSVAELQVIVGDCSFLEKETRLPVHGFLGTTFLEHFTVVLNYRQWTLGLTVP